MKTPWFVSGLVLLVTLQGLGYRHLWQDEIETAERARTVAESGFPRVIDQNGRVSVNTGGWEIEDGVLHRYTPWGQFYVGGAGIKIGRLLALSDDFSIRVPFVFAHSAVSGLTTWGLIAFGEMSPLPAVAMGLALGFQSVRILHNRTARYHALLDLFFVLGILGVAAIRRQKPWGRPLLFSSILALPHIQTLGGTALATILGIASLPIFFISLSDVKNPDRLRYFTSTVIAPFLISMMGIFILCRPLAHTTWGTFRAPRLESLSFRPGFRYVFELWLGAIVAFLALRRFKLAGHLLLALSGTILAVLLATLHEYSQWRYYLSVPLLFFLWPTIYGYGTENPPNWLRKAVAGFLILGVLSIEFQLGESKPFQGIRVINYDRKQLTKGIVQPFVDALETIKKNGRPNDPVLIDYVPQFVNWYLPTHPPAMVPDPSHRTPLSAANPIWEKPTLDPEWQIWYASMRVGFWTCEKCDYRIDGKTFDLEGGHYTIEIFSRHETIPMCIEKWWDAGHWTNAPFDLLTRNAFNPGGKGGLLILGHRCEIARKSGAHDPSS